MKRRELLTDGLGVAGLSVIGWLLLSRDPIEYRDATFGLGTRLPPICQHALAEGYPLQTWWSGRSEWSSWTGETDG